MLGFKSLLIMPSNVFPLHLMQTFPLIIWIFTEGEGDGIESRLPFKNFSTLTKYHEIKDNFLLRFLVAPGACGSPEEPRSSRDTVCKDSEKYAVKCTRWELQGYCTSSNIRYRKFMSSNCKKSCDVCPGKNMVIQ